MWKTLPTKHKLPPLPLRAVTHSESTLTQDDAFPWPALTQEEKQINPEHTRPEPQHLLECFLISQLLSVLVILYEM